MDRRGRVTPRKSHWGWLLLLVLAAAAAPAQVAVGDNVSMTANGTLAFGYSGEFGGNGSTHGLFGSGMGQISGSYYSPNFLTFNIRPFYNRNQDNSTFSSVLSETGVDSSLNLFTGSHFPGTISYAKGFTNGSQYGIPGGVGLTENSDTRNFSVTWSELLPNLPSLTATFADFANSSTLQGAAGTTDTSGRTLNFISHYRVDGWGFQGYMNRQTFQVKLPAFLAPTGSESDSSDTAYGISASHAIVWHGTFVTDYMRTDYNSETGSYRNNGTTDTADTIVAFQPTQRFTINGQFRYTGNLIGALQLQLQPGAPPLPVNEKSSDAIAMSTYGTYNLGHGFNLIGYASRQMQTFAGIDTTTNRGGGTVTYSYSRPLLGMLYLSFGMVNNATNNSGGNMGFVGSVSLKRNLGAWEVNSDFSYAQNVQTIIANYTTSNYNYGAAVRRRFGANTYWTTSYHGLQSGLAQLTGYKNRSDTFVSVFNRGRYGFSGSYGKSHGTALLTTAGTLAPTELAPVLAPDQAIYDGVSYGVGGSVIPMRKMLVNFNWYRVQSDTQTASVFSRNNSERYYGQMQYTLRKLTFRAGYWRVYQGISASGLPPQTVNTYYFNISRWFSLF